MSSLVKHLKRNIGVALFGGLGAVYKSCRLLRRQGRLSSDIKNILVVELLKIGDTVVAMPTIAALRRAYPKGKITVVAQPLVRDLFEADGAPLSVADEIVPFDTQSNLLQAFRFGRELQRIPSRENGRESEFDLAVVLDISFKSNLIAFGSGAIRRIGYDSHRRGFLLTDSLPAPPYWNRAGWEYPDGIGIRHQVHSWLTLLELLDPRFDLPEFDADECRPKLCVSDESRNWASAFLSANCLGEGGLLVCIHPGSDSAYRWEARRFAAVADFLIEERGAGILITGGPQDVELAAEISRLTQAETVIAAGETNLSQMAALLERADLLISVDTSATHIAAAVGAPVVALFGPGDPRIWRPYGEEHEVVRDEQCECLSCKNAECSKKEHLCMKGISVGEVLRAAERALVKGGDR